MSKSGKGMPGFMPLLPMWRWRETDEYRDQWEDFKSTVDTFWDQMIEMHRTSVESWEKQWDEFFLQLINSIVLNIQFPQNSQKIIQILYIITKITISRMNFTIYRFVQFYKCFLKIFQSTNVHKSLSMSINTKHYTACKWQNLTV